MPSPPLPGTGPRIHRPVTLAVMSVRDGGPRRGESRDEIIARVMREQERIDPAPVYGRRARRRLRIYLVAIFPAGLALGWVAGVVVGWSAIERLGFGVGLILTLAYLGYVLLAERDDGRIHRNVRRLMADAAPEGDEPPR